MGPQDSEDVTDYVEVGPQRLTVRITDPDGAELLGFPVVIGTPFLKDYAIYIDYQMIEIDPGLELPELMTTPRPAAQPAPGPTDLTMPLAMQGETNVDPNAEMPAAWSVPFVDVVLEQGSQFQRRSFILDTGSQITFMSSDLATSLGIDLNNPIADSARPVVGAGTCSLTIYAYYVDKVLLPTSQGTALAFIQPMVDVPGIDGGIGSNWLFDFDQSQAVDINLAGPTLKMKLNVPVSPGGDINGDGVCNVADLQLLVAHWATTASQPAGRNRADIDLSGEINVADLELLVGGWGTATGQSGYETRLDINQDGYINVGDLQLLVRDWGKQAIQPAIMTTGPTSIGTDTSTLAIYRCWCGTGGRDEEVGR